MGSSTTTTIKHESLAVVHFEVYQIQKSRMILNLYVPQSKLKVFLNVLNEAYGLKKKYRSSSL